MMYRGYGMFGWGGILVLILVLILIIIAAYFLIKYFNGNKNKSNTFREKGNALDILNERYAKGEIDEEEYIKRKKVLKG